MVPDLRILLLADSHLGFDLPVRPRVRRRRRGHDFQANFEAALEPARRREVDLVVHGGDLFHRSRVPPSLAYAALRPLKELAAQGIPVFVVPGNHERSRIPHDRFGAHPNLHIFRTPTTIRVRIGPTQVSVSGFPYQRKGIRREFGRVMAQTRWNEKEADIRLLCMHHCVEGATVGPADFAFRGAPDVVRCSDLPAGMAGILSGHIHRHQVLTRDLNGAPLPAPVFYPGSVERTAFAERGEEKGYLVLHARPGPAGGRMEKTSFVSLPARPMVVRDLHPGPAGHWSPGSLRRRILSAIGTLPSEAVARFRIHGPVSAGARLLATHATVREMAPPEVNLEVRFAGEDRARRGSRRLGTGGHEVPSSASGTTNTLNIPFSNGSVTSETQA